MVEAERRLGSVVDVHPVVRLALGRKPGKEWRRLLPDETGTGMQAAARGRGEQRDGRGERYGAARVVTEARSPSRSAESAEPGDRCPPGEIHERQQEEARSRCR